MSTLYYHSDNFRKVLLNPSTGAAYGTPISVNYWRSTVILLHSLSLRLYHVKNSLNGAIFYISIFSGGERGIRTLGTITRTHAFQACTFNHSVTSPSLTILPENARNMNCALFCARLIKNVVFYTIFIG